MLVHGGAYKVVLRLEAVTVRVTCTVSGGGGDRLECAAVAERPRLAPRLLEREVLVGVARHEEHLGADRTQAIGEILHAVRRVGLTPSMDLGEEVIGVAAGEGGQVRFLE